MAIHTPWAPICERCMPKQWNRQDGRIAKAMTFIITKLVKKRDDNKCQQCGSKKNLTVHHILKVIDHPELRWDINNMITLCLQCHIELHSLPTNILDYISVKSS